LFGALLWALCGVSGNPSQAAEVRVAVASNFLSPLRAVAARFDQSGGRRIVLIAGSTGKLFAQITAGAPFDIFFAADAARPRRLVEAGLAVATSRRTYARGRLMLIGSPYAAPDIACRQRLDPGRRAEGHPAKLAIANPATAPYGVAARAVLQKLNLWGRYRGDVLRGENIAQAYNYVATGNADLGLIAWSQFVGAPKRASCHWLVPEEFHPPIRQQVILLRRAAGNRAAREFLDFVSQPETARLIATLGYSTD